MQFSKRLDRFGEEIFAALNNRRMELEAQGMKIYNMSVGTPDFKTPEHIKKALAEAAMDDDNWKYSLRDLPELLEAVCTYYKKRFDVELTPDMVMTVYGSQEGMGHLGMALCDEGDVVLLPDPCYPVFAAGSLMAGAVPYYYPLVAEHDFLPYVKDIPEDVYYGVQSLRAAENFHITGLNMHPEIINSLAYIKKAAAITNCEVGLLEKKKAQAIVQACDEIVSGKFHNEFIVDPVQGGAGTSLNMNANEVIANRAIEILGGKKGDYTIINPNDDVNCGQSTNDVIPTAGKMTSLRLLQNLKKQLLRLYDALNEKATEFDHIIKMGRTQMQDAVPIRLGQEFKAYSVAIMRDIHRMDKAMDEMRTLNMGGTAIGTGINADEGYLRRIVPNLTEISGMDFIQAFDLIDSTQNLDPFVAVSGAVKACAVTLSKMSNDLRLMSSGPRTGFGEINLPAKQNGSSIMPGKVNPVIPEVVNQVAFNIIGNDVTITMAAEAGQLELNAFEPIIFYCMFQSIDTLGYAVQTLVDNCIVGITANEERCRYLVENSVGIITAISPHLGYQKAADIAKKAIKTGESVRSLILKEKLMDEDELNRILDPIHMTEPGISGKDYLIKK